VDVGADGVSARDTKLDLSGAFNDGYQLQPLLPWRRVGLAVIAALLAVYAWGVQ
jgi:hypothetical protein